MSLNVSSAVTAVLAFLVLISVISFDQQAHDQVNKGSNEDASAMNRLSKIAVTKRALPLRYRKIVLR